MTRSAIYACLLLIMVCFAIESRAQDRIPDLMEPDAIFIYDGIEIVRSLPLYELEEDAVRFFDPVQKVWNVYPFPAFSPAPDEYVATEFRESVQGQYTLDVEYYVSCMEDCLDYNFDFALPLPPTVNNRWYFDPAVGFYSPDPICGEFAKALAGRGEWVITSLDDANLYLCNTETGRTSAALPIELNQLGGGIVSAVLSPDETMLAFATYLNWTIYGYDFEHESLRNLGGMAVNSPFWISGYPKLDWVTPQNIVIEHAISNYGNEQSFLFQADTTQEGSLQLVYHGDRGPVMRFDDPLHFAWIGSQFVETDFSNTAEQPDCRVSVFDPATMLISTYEREGVCGYGHEIADGTGDFTILQYPRGGYLIRFNRDNDYYEEIYIDQLETLGGVSPDGRYAVVVLQTSPEVFELAVYDLQTHGLLEDRYPFPGRYVGLSWLGDRHFYHGYNRSSEITLYTIAEDVLSTTTYQYYDRVPGESALLVGMFDQTISLLSVETMQTIPIARVPADVIAYADWREDGLITVSIYQNVQPYQRYGQWQVRVSR
jgi:hypothetical protein